MSTPLNEASDDENWLGEVDVWLLAAGRHQRPWQKLGAHLWRRSGDDGAAFAVWAPHARRVSVVGDFNHWNVETHPMRWRPECGAWELFVPGVAQGALYKFAVQGATGSTVFKADPYARAVEIGPGRASRLLSDAAPVARRHVAPPGGKGLSQPMSVYEVHVGSWRRPDGGWPDWAYLSQTLLPYVLDLGFTHLELMPVNEHPFYGSWGYQPTGLYAPTARYGSAQDFRAFVASAHDVGLQVLLDWVPAHFPGDPDALACFDGTALYEHADPREGVHADWNTLIYNFGRHEVRNFLVANALYWIECFGVDGLRVDAVASMLYRDYSRAPGQWIANRDGGRENYEAIDFLREVNRVVGEQAPGALTVAEESTAFKGVTAPAWHGGLGFNYKWNLGWMHDTLAYFAMDPIHRPHHHERLSFAMMYAYSEHYVLALSHDEVVHGKGSLLGKMWGDDWQKRANLRALYAFMYAHPGRKLLFMGGELAQVREWRHDAELDWDLLAQPGHLGVQTLVRELNRLYRHCAALHARDDDPQGFAWIEVNDRQQSVFSWVRYGHDPEPPVVVVCNLTPVVRTAYRQGVPRAGAWRELLNTDAPQFGGSAVASGANGPAGCVSQCQGVQGLADSIELTLPPLAVLWLTPGPAP